MNIHLTQNSLGVARIPLVGGPFDGEQWVAVVGAPVCVPVKPPKSESQPRGGVLFSINISRLYSMESTEGEAWKSGGGGETEGPRPEQRAKRFALYCPRIVEGKATLAAFFVEEVSL